MLLFYSTTVHEKWNDGSEILNITIESGGVNYPFGCIKLSFQQNWYLLKDMLSILRKKYLLLKILKTSIIIIIWSVNLTTEILKKKSKLYELLCLCDFLPRISYPEYRISVNRFAVCCLLSAIAGLYRHIR